jgi:hypothetical protein
MDTSAFHQLRPLPIEEPSRLPIYILESPGGGIAVEVGVGVRVGVVLGVGVGEGVGVGSDPPPEK